MENHFILPLPNVFFFFACLRHMMAKQHCETSCTFSNLLCCLLRLQKACMPAGGFGIRQNFGSLKTLQFQPPTQLNTCRVRLHCVANWISTLKCLLRQFQCRLHPQVSQVLTSLARAAIEAQCVFPPTRRKNKNLYSKQQPSKKEQHHGGASRRSRGTALMF